jgi:hypothetical protein
MPFESVWLDNFFICNVCPIFYCETLADLGKLLRKGVTPEQYVGHIADKFPEMGGAPCAFHVDMCLANLEGHKIPMSWQIPLAGGKKVELEGKGGLVFRLSPEAEAFMRWQQREFLEIERLFAKAWRRATSAIELEGHAEQLHKIGIDITICRTMSEAKVLAEKEAISSDLLYEKLKFMLSFLSADRSTRRRIFKRWLDAGSPPISVYAPYASHVFEVEIFLWLCLLANLISSERASNGIDISYLFYLPFCMAFISSDKLHRKCAPLFLRDDQDFIWGDDLKSDLARLNDLYSQLPEDAKSKGVMSYAAQPPREGNFLTTKLWDKHLPSWRDRKPLPEEVKNDPDLIKHLEKLADFEAGHTEDTQRFTEPEDWMIRKSVVKKKKGNWWQLSKDLKEQ